MTIWTKTRNHYEQSDKNKPLPKWGSVTYPMCMNCGSLVVPLTSQNAKCPNCGSVGYVRVPEDKCAEVREVMKTM